MTRLHGPQQLFGINELKLAVEEGRLVGQKRLASRRKNTDMPALAIGDLFEVLAEDRAAEVVGIDRDLQAVVLPPFLDRRIIFQRVIDEAGETVPLVVRCRRPAIEDREVVIRQFDKVASAIEKVGLIQRQGRIVPTPVVVTAVDGNRGRIRHLWIEHGHANVGRSNGTKHADKRERRRKNSILSHLMVSLDREEIKKCEDGGNSAITQKSQPSSRIRRLNYTAVHNINKNSDRLALK